MNVLNHPFRPTLVPRRLFLGASLVTACAQFFPSQGKAVGLHEPAWLAEVSKYCEWVRCVSASSGESEWHLASFDVAMAVQSLLQALGPDVRVHASGSRLNFKEAEQSVSLVLIASIRSVESFS